MFVIDAVPVVFALWRRGAAGLAPALRSWPQGLAAGAMSVGSYWIAIWAMTVAPIPPVAALRESSVLFAMAIAVLGVREPLQWPRARAAGVILLGLTVIRLG
jgi:drug/metabolite transporter (DMT)-like permease